MPAENLNPYPVLTIRGRNYADMTDTDPVRVWTPDGPREAPNIVGAGKMPTKMNMPTDLREIRQILSPKAGRLTSGEWYQIRERLQRTNPDIENSMVTGPYEATATLPDFTHGKKVEKPGVASYFDGLLIQHPETDGETLLRDKKGIIKARDVWQMPLPLEGGYVKELLRKTPDLGRFFDTIYGMENAGKQLPDYACFYLLEKPAEVFSLLRGSIARNNPGSRRVSVDGISRPSDSDEDVASRAAVSGRITHWLDEAVRSNVIKLLDQAKDASLNEAVQYVAEAQQKIPRVLSLMVQDI